jgi:transforming growth factor-beta-induced protein
MQLWKILGLCLLAGLLLTGSTAAAADGAVVMPRQIGDGNLTIYETVDELGDFSVTLMTWNMTGFDTTLNEPGSYTVFAPTDAAMAELPPDVVDYLMNNTQFLTGVVSYHIAAGEYRAADLEALESLEMLQGENVTLAVTAEGLMVNDALVTEADIECSNGVVHVIDTVLEPSFVPQLTITETAVADGNFTTLVAALELTGLDETLNGTDGYTVFAPTDDAFANLPEGVLDGLLNDTAALDEVLRYHVVDGLVDGEDLAMMDEVATLQGENVTIMMTEDGLMVNDALVTVSDVICRNGLIHVVDAVLVPPGDGDGEEGADFTADTVSGEAPLIVRFTDASSAGNITSWSWDFGNGFQSTLRDPAYAYLENGTYTVTLTVTDEANTTYTEVKEDYITVGGEAPVTELSIYETAQSDADFATLTAALDLTGLNETLNGTEVFTVFAPTEDAFAALPEGTLDGLLNDTAALADVLQYHVVSGEYRAGDLANITELGTVLGENVTISQDAGNATLMVDNATVVIADIECSNGVIHAIDGVLIPA